MANLGRFSEEVGMEGISKSEYGKVKNARMPLRRSWNREAITYFLIGVP